MPCDGSCGSADRQAEVPGLTIITLVGYRGQLMTAGSGGSPDPM
jgi:hypothetical protein